VHRFLLHNGEVHETGEKLLAAGQVGFLNGWGVFSTLRVSGGALFEFERHYARMQRDAGRLRVPFPLSTDQLRTGLGKLVEANQAWDAVLRVAIVRNRGGLFEGLGIERECDLVAFTAPLKHWGDGVHLSYIANARFGASPFSGAKMTSWAENLTWYEQAHENGFDEVVLLNENGEVSECTSANIFAIHGTRVSTPPLATSGCLPGITRAVLLEEIHVPGVEIVEDSLTPSQLESADRVFITSTTRDLLPVFSIDGFDLKQATDVFQLLRDAFASYRESQGKQVGVNGILVHS
jgi:branched-chain amino acid aminotransferase